jgi:hypothetical protein
MGWLNDHLHRFRIHGKQYGIARLGDPTLSDDPDAVRLKDFRLRIKECFRYEYDFTDNWKHQIRFEAIIASEPYRRYPVCIDGRRDCPPEDCGDPWAFMAILIYYFANQTQNATLQYSIFLVTLKFYCFANIRFRLDSILGH